MSSCALSEPTRIHRTVNLLLAVAVVTPSPSVMVEVSTFNSCPTAALPVITGWEGGLAGSCAKPWPQVLFGGLSPRSRALSLR